MRRMSLVAACCSAPSRISRACAAIVCFSFATDFPRGAAFRLTVVFLRGFFFTARFSLVRVYTTCSVAWRTALWSADHLPNRARNGTTLVILVEALLAGVPCRGGY